jgi:hypothetical protein
VDPVRVELGMTMTGVVNFVTPINKIFNGPLKGVYLVHNSDGDLSLYRGNEHVWSAGRLKGPISDVQWSPKGGNKINCFIACFNFFNCFI